VSAFVFFDDTDEPAGLDGALRAQYGSGRRIESQVLFTEIVGDTAITIIKVTIDGRYRHQLYAIDERTWSLTGIYTLYMDAMRELLRWRRYLDEGGSVTAWQRAHPDGVYPERSGFGDAPQPASPPFTRPPRAASES
jgi:hypothetical protein